MTLEPVDKAYSTMVMLYELLAEREPHQNISHKGMPSFPEHMAFVLSRPYQAWYVMVAGQDRVGAIYLSRQEEIGVFVFKQFRGMGYAKDAIRQLMARHPKPRYLANINPANDDSIALFESLGGKRIQVTYELA